jgi:hypothetical protein
MYYLTLGALERSRREVEIFHRFLEAGVTFALLFKRALAHSGRVRWLILGNGTLLFDAIAQQLALDKNVEFVTQEFFDGLGSWVYRKNGAAIDLAWPEAWAAFRSRELSPEDVHAVETLMAEKRAGLNLVVPMNEDATLGRFRERMAGRPFVCLFANFAWDTTVLDRNSIFPSMEAWLTATLAFWKRARPEAALVVRAHPAEVRLRAPSARLVRDMVAPYLEGAQIILVDSSDAANSYEIIEAMQYGVVYGSSIGLEIAYAGKQCVIAGDPHYRGLDFVVSPQTVQDYFLALSDLNRAGPRVPPREELMRYLYYLYFDRVKSLAGFENRYREARTTLTVTNGQEFRRANAAVMATFFKDISS